MTTTKTTAAKVAAVTKEAAPVLDGTLEARIARCETALGLARVEAPAEAEEASEAKDETVE